MEKHKLLKLTKLALATIIIVMGAYGYYHFFSSILTPLLSLLVVALFIIIEIAILLMTTTVFEDTTSYGPKFSLLLMVVFLLMWLLSFVGIDQTMWSILESKYYKVEQEKATINAKKETQKKLIKNKAHLEQYLTTYKNELKSLQEEIKLLKKDLDKKQRHFNDTVYNNGLMCDTKDCLARKANAQSAIDISQALLQEQLNNKKALLEKIKETEAQIAHHAQSIEAIIKQEEAFKSQNSISLKHKEEEALLHIRLMEFINPFFKNKINTPERAYVMLISAVPYPIYMFFVFFAAMQTPQNRKKRAQKQLEKAKEAEKRKSEKKTLFHAVMLLVAMQKKIVMYLIKTRKRKVITKEIEIEKIVEKEIEIVKEIYKEGKEIVEVEVEVPHIIEKEVIVEKIKEVPIVEKELIVIPADVDLNKLNELTGNTLKPKKLKNFLEDMGKDIKEYTINLGADNDKHNIA